MQKKRDLSLYDVFKSLKAWFHYFLSKWVIVSLVLVVGAMIGFAIAATSKPSYTATLSFVLSTETKVSGLSGLAGQFGFDLGSNNNDVFTGDNILTLLRSKRMVKRALFKSPAGSTENLANIIVKEWGWDEKWRAMPALNNAIPFPADSAQVTPVQDSLISEIHAAIINNYLSVSRLDKKLSVFLIKTTSSNQVFACYLTKFLMDESARFYIDTKTRIAKQNLMMLQREADSLRGVLGSSISSTASSVDATYNLNPALQVQRAPVQRGQFNTSVLGTAYGEVIRNLELAKIHLQREMPLYQIVDEPTLPLRVSKRSKLKFTALGGVCGGILILMFLFISRSILKSKEEERSAANQGQDILHVL